MESIKLVILESPYAGDIFANVAYARRCLKDCALRGESAQASHLLLTQVLDDTNVDERALGIALGLAWRSVAHYSVFYTDRGWSNGMIAALSSALLERRPLKLRALDGAVQFPDPFDISTDLFSAVDLSTASAHA
ncbi:hypothetical protein BRAO375_3660021 [Bradyrhizobium sp. ORS 375]|uniref:DUF7768 domain-containing protein n=1 Tax=Bradyrhizobium sp. (strain ORS 375) TaxID=566679 RepID=UPI0002406402|nr:hypothetical protein [Bradyrhizobium sp. ORS 375]CCD94627.1 hypothetical protein BRAO375_3660021 [Bradyrhizobium sp. ORS 375]